MFFPSAVTLSPVCRSSLRRRNGWPASDTQRCTRSWVGWRAGASERSRVWRSTCGWLWLLCRRGKGWVTAWTTESLSMVSGVGRRRASSSMKTQPTSRGPCGDFERRDILLFCFFSFVLNIFIFCRFVYSASRWLKQWAVQKSRGEDCWICTVLTVWGPRALVFEHSVQQRVAVSWFHYTGPHMS